MLYVANCGDSRAVAAVAAPGTALVAKDLSRDHKPDDPIEKARIVACGGFVKPPPREGLSARVYLDPAMTMIGLAMARSIGDYTVKRVGVTAEPEVIVYELDETYKFLIMASDGVWEFISSQVRGGEINAPQCHEITSLHLLCGLGYVCTGGRGHCANGADAQGRRRRAGLRRRLPDPHPRGSDALAARGRRLPRRCTSLRPRIRAIAPVAR